MNPEASFYISLAYVSIAFLSTVGLVLKRFKAVFKNPEFIEYLLHAFHIPPYLIAAYWYWDSYNNNDAYIYAN